MEKTSVKYKETRSARYHEKKFLTVQSNEKTKNYWKGEWAGLFFSLLKMLSEALNKD